MEITGDELAGIVDLFGGLTASELGEAIAELAYRQGEEYDPTAYETRIETALTSYRLVAIDASSWTDDDTVDDELLVAGPLAFPGLPPDAEDLPHILDIETRDVEPAGDAVADQFRDDARAAIDAGDTERIQTLLDASYELEPWAGVDLAEIRSALAEATPTS